MPKNRLICSQLACRLLQRPYGEGFCKLLLPLTGTLCLAHKNHAAPPYGPRPYRGQEGSRY